MGEQSISWLEIKLARLEKWLVISNIGVDHFRDDLITLSLSPAWVYNTMKKTYTAIVKISLIT